MKKKKKKAFEKEFLYEQDENFAFIAGYTDGGVAFGITWDEQEGLDKIEEGNVNYKVSNYKVDLEKVIEAMEIADDQIRYYYYKKTEEIVFITDEEQRVADDYELSELDTYEEWERDFIEMAIDIEANYQDYILLPDKLEVNEYQIMTDFAYSMDDNKKMNILLNELNGRGAFRNFSNKVKSLGLNKKWYEFRENSYKEVAIKWCDDNNLILIDKDLHKE